MAIRQVEQVIAPKKPHFVGDGFRVSNFIPSVPQLSMARMSPFIMLDYNTKHHFLPSPEQPRGVGAHPHRGFETVTIAYKGSVSHHDSSGGKGTIREGDVQWMTAASGVLHKEYHSEEFSQTGGDFQMVQLWVNLPAKDKMSTPKYQALTYEDIPKIAIDKSSRIEVIAGEYNNIKGIADTFTSLHMMNAYLTKEEIATFSFSSAYNTVMLVLEGTIRVNGIQDVATDHLVLMANEGEDFEIQATDDAVVLVLSGEPIYEPITSYGPFVMNTQQEIVQAMEDFNAGKFGYLED